MILIEVTSEANEELFENIPFEHHKTLLRLFEKNMIQGLGDSNFMKVYSFELIKIYFKENNYQEFDLYTLKKEFFNYCNKHFDLNSKEIMFPYLEDMKILIWDFLYSK